MLPRASCASSIARTLSLRSSDALQEDIRKEHNAELRTLSQRRWPINYAITCATLAALLVCLLMGVAFIGFLLNSDFSLLIASLFIGAMAAFNSWRSRCFCVKC